MITDVRESRLLVTSDTHIGNLFCNARRGLVRFLEYARDNRYNVCLNGDGIDVQYTSLTRFTAETSALVRDLRQITAEMTVYYTIGNHDIILEHYLGDWGGLRLVPFLNVRSGTSRIRVEHGHLYDTFLMKHPELRYGVTRSLAAVCRVYPPAYHWPAQYEVIKFRLLNRLRARKRPALRSAAMRAVNPSFLDAAEELSRRGFDAVIFGHTHQPGTLPLNGNRARYFNTGSWFTKPYYVVIEEGNVELKPWPP